MRELSGATWLFHNILQSVIVGKNVLNAKCMFSFPLQLLSEPLFVLRSTEQDIIINMHRSSSEVPVTFVRF